MHFEYRSGLEKIQTQINRALLELEILLIHHEPFQPQCKASVERLVKLGILKEVSGRKRGRIYCAEELLNIVAEG